MPNADISKWTGPDIQGYLSDLDRNPEIELTAWEAEFVSTNLNRVNFSNKQIEIVKKLVEKYGDDLS